MNKLILLGLVLISFASAMEQDIPTVILQKWENKTATSLKLCTMFRRKPNLPDLDTATLVKVLQPGSTINLNHEVEFDQVPAGHYIANFRIDGEKKKGLFSFYVLFYPKEQKLVAELYDNMVERRTAKDEHACETASFAIITAILQQAHASTKPQLRIELPK